MHGHIVPKTTYFAVFIALSVLLAVTVLASKVDVGALNAPVAMAIALAKAALIVLFFMHVRYGSPLLRVFAAGGFVWLLILFILILPDYLTRATPAPETETAVSHRPHDPG